MRIETDSIEDIIKAIGDGKKKYTELTGVSPNAIFLGSKLHGIVMRDHKKLGLKRPRVYGVNIGGSRNIGEYDMFFTHTTEGYRDWDDTFLGTILSDYERVK